MLLHVLAFNGYSFSKTIRIFASDAFPGSFLVYKGCIRGYIKGSSWILVRKYEKLVQEKIGSELVVTSMFLQIGRCMKMLLPCSVVEVFNK